MLLVVGVVLLTVVLGVVRQNGAPAIAGPSTAAVQPLPPQRDAAPPGLPAAPVEASPRPQAKADLSNPEEMLRHYYQLINSDRFADAYQLRSRRSRSSTNFEAFRKPWSNNNSISIDRVSTVDRQPSTAKLKIRLLANDSSQQTGVAATTPYEGTVKLTLEEGAWRYDGGDFTAEIRNEAAHTDRKPPTPVDPAGPSATVRFHHISADNWDSGPLLDVWAGFEFSIQIELEGLDPTRPHTVDFRGYWEDEPDKWRDWGDEASPVPIPAGSSSFSQGWEIAPLIGRPWFTQGRNKVEVLVDDRVVQTQLYNQVLPPEEAMKAVGRDASRYPKRW